MAYTSRPATGMSHASQWLAVLRIIVGLYFAKAVITKLGIITLGGVPVPGASERWVNVMPKIVAGQADGNPVVFYRQFLENTVLTHPGLFAQLTAWGETITGIGLTLGLLTGVASLVGLMLVVNYGLATQWMSTGQQGFHIVLTALMIAFFFARAGRTWGLDARLWSARPKSLFARRPFS